MSDEESKNGYGHLLIVPATIMTLVFTAGFWTQIAELKRIDAQYGERLTAINQDYTILARRVMELSDRTRQVDVNTERLTRIEESVQRLDEKGSRATILLQQRLSILEKRRK